MSCFRGGCQVELGEFFIAKEDVIAAVWGGWSQGDGLALEGSIQAKDTALEVELAFGLDVAGVID